MKTSPQDFIMTTLANEGEHGDITLCVKGEALGFSCSEVREAIQSLLKEKLIWGNRPNNPISFRLPSKPPDRRFSEATRATTMEPYVYISERRRKKK